MASGIRISIRADISRIQRDLDRFASKQVPFATAQAINAIARRVQAGEQRAIEDEFTTATPFTVKSVAVQTARKSSPEATIYLRDVAAQYLAPFIDGGVHHLSGRALLNPKDVQLNQYGNIPRGKLQSLKGKPGVFIGTIVTKRGERISGVWQRPTPIAVGKSGKPKVNRFANTTGHLKLLIRFGDALPVHQHLPWYETGRRIINQFWRVEFAVALRRAMASAK
ncbi:MAG TPA: hypothetical protein VHW02_07805 [Rhizomicrobium sp.]|jgi:hypothetical protein|nr:hypothetical protein [Rhizomicrobium sp.]